MSDSEIITILICFHFNTFRNFKHYYNFYVKEHLKDEFPHQLSYTRFVEREARVLVPLMMFLKLLCFGQCTGITLLTVHVSLFVTIKGSIATRYSKG